MPGSNSSSGDTHGADGGVNRRTVLKSVGTGAFAGVGLVGTASAHEVDGKPVFCGCTELCVCVDGNAGLLMAQADPDGGYHIGFLTEDGELDPYPTGQPLYSGDFCVDTAELDLDHGRIIGLQVAGTRWVNPNPCAQEALEAEQEQLDSTHERLPGTSGNECVLPPCQDWGDVKADIDVTWRDCDSVRVTGNEGAVDAITVYSMHCFPGDGPCPDDNLGVTIEDPELPLTIDDQYLATDDVPYYHWAVELDGDVEQDRFEKPDDLDCSFGPLETVDVTFEDCETVTLDGSAEDVGKIEIDLIRCFDDDSDWRTALDGSTGCPTGHIVTREVSQLPLTLGREELALGDEQYSIGEVTLFGPDGSEGGSVEPPEELDCNFDPIHQAINIEFEMDDQTITLAEDEDAVSQVTVTGSAEFGFAGWDEADHAFITVWAQSEDIDTGGATNSDAERYFDIDQPSVVRNEVAVTFDVPPEVGDPASGESIETEITGTGFVGLEDGTDPQESFSIFDRREYSTMTLTVERE